MAKKDSALRLLDRLPTRVKACAILGVLFLWAFFMAGVFAAPTCLRETRDMEKKRASCRVALAPSHLFAAAADRREHAALRVEQAVALSRLGRREEAVAAFRKALKLLEAPPGAGAAALGQPLLSDARRRISRHPDFEAAILEDLKQALEREGAEKR